MGHRSSIQVQEKGAVPIMTAVQTITLKDLPAMEVVGIRRRIPTRLIGALITEAAQLLRSQPMGPTMCLYHDPVMDPNAIDVEAVFPVAVGGTRTLPPVKVVAVTHTGPYETVGQAYQALFAWLNEQGHQLAGPARELYLVGPDSGKLPAEYVTEVQLPIA
jgi:effector-binding domain-containing protein